MEITEAELALKVEAAIKKERETFEAESKKQQQTADLELKKRQDSITALETKNQEILAEKKKLGDLTKKFDGVDVEQLLKFKETLDKSEDAKLLAEGKLDEVIAKRTEKERIAFNAKMEELTAERDKYLNESKKIQSASNRKDITIAVSQAAQAAGVIASAIPDIVTRALQQFTVDSDGTIVVRDAKGDLVKDGTEARSPSTFIKGLKESAPHFWPGSKGADLKGSEKTEAAEVAAAKGDMKAYREVRQGVKK